MPITDNFFNKIINNLKTKRKKFFLYGDKKISYAVDSFNDLKQLKPMIMKKFKL